MAHRSQRPTLGSTKIGADKADLQRWEMETTAFISTASTANQVRLSAHIDNPGGSSAKEDPIADINRCQQEVIEFEKLGIETVHVYSIDKNYEFCLMTNTMPSQQACLGPRVGSHGHQSKTYYILLGPQPCLCTNAPLQFAVSVSLSTQRMVVE